MNQFVYTVLRPTDRCHKAFDSTWIHGETEAEAREILSRTYSPENGFVLELKYNLETLRMKKSYAKALSASMDSAML